MEELEKVFVKTIKSGKYTGTLEWYKREGILIDNCFRSVVRDETGNVIKIIDTIRPIPDKIRPDIIVPPPIEGTKHLYYFTPGYLTSMYVFEPPLAKPVVAWVVRINDQLVICDARTGDQIGKSITFDLYTAAFVASSTHTECFKRSVMEGLFKNAGYTVKSLVVPDLSEIERVIKNPSTKYFFAVGHASYAAIKIAPHVLLKAQDIEAWMKNRDKMWFAYLMGCGTMVKTGEGTLSYAFRKGSMTDTVTIGTKKILLYFTLSWENMLFELVFNDGKTWKDAFDLACAAYPKQEEYMAFCGDNTTKLAPEVISEPPPLPSKTHIEFRSIPQGAEIWVKKH